MGACFGESPTRVVLCPAACETAQGDPDARVDVQFGCKTWYCSETVGGAAPGLAVPEACPTVAQMLSLQWLSALARYNRWMNDKLYGLSATLSDEARKRDSGAFFKSIHGTFNHLLIADRVWLARFTGESVPDGHMGPGNIRSLDQELYADFEELRRQRALTDDALSAWVSELTQERLAAPLVYLRRGQKHESPLWGSVAHLFNHQTHHRGQITTLLTQQGCDPGVTDLVAMLREEAAPASER